MIYIVFKPMSVEQQAFKDIPLFEITDFKVHELDTKGLKSLLSGSESQRFKDRYTVENINYTDNSKKFLANMSAKNGVHKEDVTTLRGDVRYKREDGLVFEGEEAIYNKKLALLSTNEKYIIYQGKNNIRGETLLYNSQTNRVQSTKIQAIYQLQESKK